MSAGTDQLTIHDSSSPVRVTSKKVKQIYNPKRKRDITPPKSEDAFQASQSVDS